MPGGALLSWLANVPNEALRPMMTAASIAAQEELERLGNSKTPSDEDPDLTDTRYWAYPIYSWMGNDGFLPVNINGSTVCFKDGAVVPGLFFRAEAADEYPGLQQKLFKILDGMDEGTSQDFEDVLQDGMSESVGTRFRSPFGFFFVMGSHKNALTKIVQGVTRSGPNGDLEGLTNALHAFLLYELAKFIVTAQVRPFDIWHTL